MPPCTTRPTTPQDELFSFQVYASTRMEEMALVDWPGEQKEAFLQMQFNAQRQHYLNTYPQAEYLIIEKDSLPIGRMIVDRSERAILLMDIALLPEHRNTGLGSHLIKSLLAEAAQAGRPVQLHVETYNPAMRLYQRFGFEKTGEITFYNELTWQPPVSPAHA